MSTQEQMTIDERYKYLRLMQPRYLKAHHKERGVLLDEMEQVTRLHCKSLIRLVGGDLVRKPRSRTLRQALRGGGRWRLAGDCRKHGLYLR